MTTEQKLHQSTALIEKIEKVVNNLYKCTEDRPVETMELIITSAESIGKLCEVVAEQQSMIIDIQIQLSKIQPDYEQ